MITCPHDKHLRWSPKTGRLLRPLRASRLPLHNKAGDLKGSGISPATSTWLAWEFAEVPCFCGILWFANGKSWKKTSHLWVVSLLNVCHLEANAAVVSKTGSPVCLPVARKLHTVVVRDDLFFCFGKNLKCFKLIKFNRNHTGRS